MEVVAIHPTTTTTVLHKIVVDTVVVAEEEEEEEKEQEGEGQGGHLESSGQGRRWKMDQQGATSVGVMPLAAITNVPVMKMVVAVDHTRSQIENCPKSLAKRWSIDLLLTRRFLWRIARLLVTQAAALAPPLSTARRAWPSATPAHLPKSTRGLPLVEPVCVLLLLLDSANPIYVV